MTRNTLAVLLGFTLAFGIYQSGIIEFIEAVHWWSFG